MEELDMTEGEVLLEMVMVARILKEDGTDVIRYDCGEMSQISAIGLLAFAQQAIFIDAHESGQQ